jgi:lipoate-protein ligase A
METWRLIDLGIAEPLVAQTFYEAVARAVDAGYSPNTILFVQPSRPYVCIGYHQELGKEVDQDYCRENNLMVIRRSQGGGATYLNGDQLFYQVVANKRSKVLPMDVEGLFERFLAVTVYVYRRLGLAAEFKALNDVVVQGRKISGNGAGSYGRDTIILVGNIILDLDYNSMSQVLKVPSEKFRDKMAKSMVEWVTSIKRERGCPPSVKEVKELLAEGYEQVLGINLVRAEPTPYERAAWEGEVKPRHLSNEWMYTLEMRHSHLIQERAVKVAGDVSIVEVEYRAKKLIRVTAELVGDQVRDLMFSGDFFMMPEDGLPCLESALRGVNLDRDSILMRVRAAYESGGIRTPGMGPEDFTEAVMKLRSDQ